MRGALLPIHFRGLVFGRMDDIVEQKMEVCSLFPVDLSTSALKLQCQNRKFKGSRGRFLIFREKYLSR
jgi:hypothetical protein